MIRYFEQHEIIPIRLQLINITATACIRTHVILTSYDAKTAEKWTFLHDIKTTLEFKKMQTFPKSHYKSAKITVPLNSVFNLPQYSAKCQLMANIPSVKNAKIPLPLNLVFNLMKYGAKCRFMANMLTVKNHAK